MAQYGMTFRPRTSRKRARVHGFFARMRSLTGQRVIRARRTKGRARLAQ